MPRYNKNNTKELKAFLYNSCVHDAELKNIRYDCGGDSIVIELYNPISHIGMNLTFRGIIIALAIKGEWQGSRTTIISLTAEDDFSYLQNYLKEYSEYSKDALYLLFQMFSGDEMHIVSNEVIIEATE